MKLTAERADLNALLSKVTGVVERRNTIPILANVVLSALDGVMFARATDLDIEITASCSATITTNGETTVNAAMLADIVKLIPQGALIQIETTERGVSIAAGKFKTILATLPVEDYPVLASTEFEVNFDIPVLEFKRVFEKTKFAMSDEETRYYLNGVYLHHANGAMAAVATDGHRLAHITYSGHGDAFPGVIVPRKTVALISTLAEIGDVSLSISETKIKIQHGTTTIVSKVIDGTFPDYTRVIPEGNQNKVTVSALEMKIASNRVASVSSERAPALKMDVGIDGVVLSVAGSDGNTARDEVSGSLDGMPLTIGFNAKYMVEAMSMCNGDDVVIEMKDAGSPALMRPSEDDRFMIVLMPMRV